MLLAVIFVMLFGTAGLVYLGRRQPLEDERHFEGGRLTPPVLVELDVFRRWDPALTARCSNAEDAA
ncbi:MAG: hypothetical protein JO147_00210 [Actinobacteria bacterium]|nr:hypothetical protein [Actinomycetota bacterium]